MADTGTLQIDGREGDASQRKAGPCLRILVADDDICIRKLSAGLLSRSGHDVTAVEDGEKGWEALHGGKFDLLITDNEMPGLTGIELVQKIRAARLAVPVILVTGTPPVDELKLRPGLQIAATLLKPFAVEELLQAVAGAVRTLEG